MERPYIDKWQQYLLREGTEKAPYFKNIYGGINKVTFANVKSVEKTMSRILKTPVTIKIPGQAVYKALTAYAVDGSIFYTEYVNNAEYGGTGWVIHKSLNYVTAAFWGVENSIPWSYFYKSDESIDPSLLKRGGSGGWDYFKIMQAGKVSYLVKQVGRKLSSNKNLQPFKTKLTALKHHEGELMELIPGTKAYDAVKRNVFKD